MCATTNYLVEDAVGKMARHSKHFRLTEFEQLFYFNARYLYSEK